MNYIIKIPCEKITKIWIINNKTHFLKIKQLLFYFFVALLKQDRNPFKNQENCLIIYKRNLLGTLIRRYNRWQFKLFDIVNDHRFINSWMKCAPYACFIT